MHDDPSTQELVPEAEPRAALPLCGGGRLLRRRSETDRFSLFFSICIFFIVFSCVLFVFSFMASPHSVRTDAL